MLKWTRVRKSLGSWLKEKRLSSKLSQAEVMQGTHYSNLQFLSNIERGLAGPPPVLLQHLLKVYQVDKEEFIEFITNSIAAEIRRQYK